MWLLHKTYPLVVCPNTDKNADNDLSMALHSALYSTDSLRTHMAHFEWMNKHVIQYSHSAFACVCEPVCVCLPKVSYAPPSSQIPLALLTYSPQNTITRTPRNSESGTHLFLLIAQTVSMLRLTTQQPLIPLPVTFYKQD